MQSYPEKDDPKGHPENVSDIEPIISFQQAIVEHLKEDQNLSRINVLREDRHELDSVIEQNLNTIGISVVVQTADVGVSNPNIPGPLFDSIRFTVAVIENTIINRSPSGLQVDALTTALHISRRLHHWRAEEVSAFCGMTIVASPNHIVYAPANNLLGYDVNFQLGLN